MLHNQNFVAAFSIMRELTSSYGKVVISIKDNRQDAYFCGEVVVRRINSLSLLLGMKILWKKLQTFRENTIV